MNDGRENCRVIPGTATAVPDAAGLLMCWGCRRMTPGQPNSEGTTLCHSCIIDAQMRQNRKEHERPACEFYGLANMGAGLSSLGLGNIFGLGGRS